MLQGEEFKVIFDHLQFELQCHGKILHIPFGSRYSRYVAAAQEK